MESSKKDSTEQLRKLAFQHLSKVGVQQGVSKPGDGTYSALLSKPASKR